LYIRLTWGQNIVFSKKIAASMKIQANLQPLTIAENLAFDHYACHCG
jgi:hypothetical protein